MKVSKRKQEIADRLNAWTIFKDKHKELCEWLAQMERKVMHSSDYFSIEEMVEKLKKVTSTILEHFYVVILSLFLCVCKENNMETGDRFRTS